MCLEVCLRLMNLKTFDMVWMRLAVQILCVFNKNDVRIISVKIYEKGIVLKMSTRTQNTDLEK